MNIFNSLKKKPKKIAISMRGGGARCASYIGVLKALEENDIKVDMLLGASGGAIVAGSYAADIPLSKILEHFEKFTPRQYIGLDSLHDLSIASDDMAMDFARQLVGDVNIEDLGKRLWIQATNIDTGKIDYLDTGVLVRAAVASSAIPFAVKPVEINGSYYCDGDIASGYGVRFLKENGADFVIGFSAGGEHTNLSVLYKRFVRPIDIMTERIRELDQKLDPVDFLFDKLGEGYGLIDNTKSPDIYEQGYEKAQGLIPALKKLL